MTRGDECKLVVDDTVGEDDLARYEQMEFGNFFLQPCAGYDAGVGEAIALATSRPRWRLSLQIHKIIGVP